MKKLLIAGLATAGLLLSPGVAHAVPVGDTGPFSGPAGDKSDSAFFTDVAPVILGDNATASSDTLSKMDTFGNLVCTKLSDGFSEGEMAATLATPPNPVPVFLARYVIHSAEWHFCPDFYGTTEN